ncbi:MAG: type II toxin-antitoxin system RelE/ParE family toxin [Armatimonadota bacterium]|nr:type II toxin-antitoxin system RelE/ParE family toxin [Armatimonadota bacterium]
MDDELVKPLEFVGSSRKDLQALPPVVRQMFGRALFLAQLGGKPASVKPLKGYRGAGILEIVEDYDTDAYRAVYTVRFAGIVYVLHVFQKKSRVGIATPTRDLDLIARRLKKAEEMYADRNADQ